LLLRLPGELWLRLAERRFRGSLFQLPPRFTRLASPVPSEPCERVAGMGEKGEGQIDRATSLVARRPNGRRARYSRARPTWLRVLRASVREKQQRNRRARHSGARPWLPVGQELAARWAIIAYLAAKSKNRTRARARGKRPTATVQKVKRLKGKRLQRPGQAETEVADAAAGRVAAAESGTQVPRLGAPAPATEHPIGIACHLAATLAAIVRVGPS